MERVERLFEAYAKRAWGLARSLSRTPQDADDLVQQAFEIAIRKREQIPEEPWPWLAQIIANCARNQRRYAARRQGMADVEEAQVTGREPDPSIAAGKHELAERVHGALSELNAEEREAVALCHLAGLTQDEACRVVGVGLNTLKSRVRRGMVHLQERLRIKEAEFAAYLAGVAFAPPADGWDAALRRWKEHAHAGAPEDLPSPHALSVNVAGLAAIAVLLGWGTWSVTHNPASTSSAQSDGIGREASAATSEAAPTASSVEGRGSPSSGVGDAEKKAARVVDGPRDAGSAAGSAAGGSEQGDTEGAQDNSAANSLVVRTTFFQSGAIESQWTELLTAHGPLKHGQFTLFFPNQVPRQSGQFEQGLREGLWTSWYQNGAMESQREFRKGKREGPMKTWYEDGAPWTSGLLVNDLREGELTTWHPNGQRALLQNFLHDQLHGLETEFDEQGRKRRETLWENNKRHGWEILFDEAGTEVSRKLFQQGR